MQGERFAKVIWSLVLRTHVPNRNLMESSGMYICVECSNKFMFGLWSLENIFPAIVQLHNHTIFLIVSVFKIYYRDMMYEIWNASFCQDDKNKLAIVKCCLIQILKNRYFCHFCRVFIYVHFECFGELKTRYHHIDPFTCIMNIVNIFYVWKIIIEM